MLKMCHAAPAYTILDLFALPVSLALRHLPQRSVEHFHVVSIDVKMSVISPTCCWRDNLLEIR